MAFRRDTITVLHREGHYLLHTADTDGGSSGAPVFDQRFRLIAIHAGKGLKNPAAERGPAEYMNNRAVRIDRILRHILESSDENDSRLQSIGLRRS